MALVKPFNAVVFRHDETDISRLIAPPYDVISVEQREALLAKDPHNIVALELPEGPLDPNAPGNRYETGAARWIEWSEQNILVKDLAPAIYVLEQSWEHDGRHVRRRALVGAIELRPFSDGVVLPHERTLPKALDDRLRMTRACAANLSQVFGLFTDPAGETDPVFENAMRSEPISQATDTDGVLSRLWAIHDTHVIEQIHVFMAPKQIFIADGHHRYTTALAYRDERRAEDAARDITHAEAPAYDFVMMALVNMDDPDLLVLPTHRVARAEGAFDTAAFWTALGEYFDVTDLPSGHPSALLASSTRTTFIVKSADGTTRLVSLKSDIDPATVIATEHRNNWKRLDVAILQELILKPLLGIHPDDPSTLERLTFVKDAHDALKVPGGDVAFVVNPTRMEQLRAVALDGDTMPQKSTYFYPKLLSGLLMKSLA
ncbi:MAG: DUF1015 domain-containing protein [Coriobacteriia bacterium]|nr:DUF1015 domain-containing protein [Coriobacteriia bacterium]